MHRWVARFVLLIFAAAVVLPLPGMLRDYIHISLQGIDITEFVKAANSASPDSPAHVMHEDCGNAEADCATGEAPPPAKTLLTCLDDCGLIHIPVLLPVMATAGPYGPGIIPTVPSMLRDGRFADPEPHPPRSTVRA